MTEKIPFYNMLNMLLIGLVFAGCNLIIFFDKIYTLSNNYLSGIKNFGFETVLTICFFAVIYEIGFIINRLGSVVIEPILKITKAIQFNNNYKKFNDSKKDKPILEVLSREYALARSSITLFTILSIIAVFQQKPIIALLFVLTTLLFVFSARKHCLKITQLIKD